MPCSLRTTQEDRFLCKNGLQIIFLKIPPFLSSFIFFYPTQGHPFEAFGIHSDNYLQHGLKVLEQKVPFPNVSCISICSYFYQLRLLLSSSFLNINPSYDLSFQEQLVYSAKSLAQWNSTTTSLVVHPPISPKTTNKEEKFILEKVACLTPPFRLLSYLPPSITQTSLQCCSSLHHPQLGVDPVSITHKQTRFPTHAFLAATTE